MRSWACDRCDVRWWPGHVKHGSSTKDSCPECGGGVRRSKDYPSTDSIPRWGRAMRERREREEAEAVELEWQVQYETACMLYDVEAFLRGDLVE